MRLFATCVLISVTATAVAQDVEGTPEKKPAKPEVTMETATSPLDFTVKDIDGKDVVLSKYRGDVVLMVNVASKCGMTPQYEQLQGLHEKYAGKGLRVLGFPANNFMRQEPGTDEQIKEFCTTKFGVEFDMFAKASVKGGDSCELYKYLTSKEKTGEHGGAIRWNFTKFLIGRDGKVINRFGPRTRPDAPEVVDAIERALKQKKPE